MRRVAIAICVCAGLCGPALAHAFLEQAHPAAGENLHAGPSRIELHFTEALEPAFSGIDVSNESGANVASGPVVVKDGEMDLPLNHLAPGRYRVSWHAVSVDTHRTEGRYNFLVLP
ncbi:MAG: copper resistance protein CopC [Proteobacteria bacterium]|nr:copper resistance protein CopC [Pseudomonadota bacterium]